MGQPRPLFHLFLSFHTNITNFTANRYVKNVHPVYGAWIQTFNSHDKFDRQIKVSNQTTQIESIIDVVLGSEKEFVIIEA